MRERGALLNHLEESWPDSAQASLAARILPYYLRIGPSRFVLNADVELEVWRSGDQMLPVVYRERPSTPRTADVCSPWNHYVRYPLGEIARHRGGFRALFGKTLLHLSMPFLSASAIDDVVSVNNWLISTNPAPALDRAAVERLTGELCERFPDRAILFRTVNPKTDPALAAHLTACGYTLVASRTVYLLDPTSAACRRSTSAQRDRKLARDGRYERVAHDEFASSDMPRLTELHRLLYLEKHSAMNAEYSALFFETAWRNRFFEFQGLRKDGRIDAYITYFELGGLLYWAMAGYDTRVPEALGLYRRGAALMMEESRRRGLPLHMSAGAGAFKHHRGGQPSVEYDAVYDRHLPPHRRIGWRLLQAAGFLQDRKVRRGW